MMMMMMMMMMTILLLLLLMMMLLLLMLIIIESNETTSSNVEVNVCKCFRCCLALTVLMMTTLRPFRPSGASSSSRPKLSKLNCADKAAARSRVRLQTNVRVMQGRWRRANATERAVAPLPMMTAQVMVAAVLHESIMRDRHASMPAQSVLSPTICADSPFAE